MYNNGVISQIGAQYEYRSNIPKPKTTQRKTRRKLTRTWAKSHDLIGWCNSIRRQCTADPPATNNGLFSGAGDPTADSDSVT